MHHNHNQKHTFSISSVLPHGHKNGTSYMPILKGLVAIQG